MPRKYDLDWPDGFDDLNIELKCFRHDHKEENGGLGKAGHFWRIVDILWGPKNRRKYFIKHPWAEKMIEELCRWTYLSISGPGGIGKTDCLALWIIVNWACDPVNTMAITTSTTLSASKKRVWGSIVDYFNAAPGLPGKMLDATGLIRTVMPQGEARVSDKSGIMLVAGEASKEKASMDKLDGCHNKRVFLIADELPKLSPALIKFATGNLSKNLFFQFVGIGNPASKYDPHGILSEPEAGWKSITEFDYEWKTKLGYAVRFDSEQSPNVLAGKVIYDFLPKEQDIAISKHRNGENSPVHWAMCRGFWPPEGSDPQCIYTEADLVEGEVTAANVRWSGQPTPVAALDPARSSGGDGCIATLGLLGLTHDGSRKLLVTKTVAMHDSKSNPDPYNFQIADQFIKLCQTHGVAPENMAYDSTGPAGEIGQIISNKLGNAVLFPVDFNGRASNLPHGAENKPCHDQYADKVSELWMVGKDYMHAGQIKGLTTECIEDLLKRRETTRKLGQKGSMRAVESKKEMKKRGIRSPDYGDSFFVLLDLARKRHKFRSEIAKARNLNAQREWEELMTKAEETEKTALPMNLAQIEDGDPEDFVPQRKGWQPEEEVDALEGYFGMN